MNKLLPALILAVLISGVSRAESDQYWSTNHYDWSAQTVTQSARVRVPITKTKPKFYLAKLQRPVVRLSLSDNNDDYYDDFPDIQIGYRRPELVNCTANVQDTISDEIKLRLVLSRKKALEKYQENWG